MSWWEWLTKRRDADSETAQSEQEKAALARREAELHRRVRNIEQLADMYRPRPKED